MDSKTTMIPEINEETKAWLESLPKKESPLTFKWTDEMDKKLYFAKGRVTNEILSKEFGCCKDTLVRRYRYLEEKWGPR